MVTTGCYFEANGCLSIMMPRPKSGACRLFMGHARTLFLNVLMRIKSRDNEKLISVHFRHYPSHDRIVQSFQKVGLERMVIKLKAASAYVTGAAFLFYLGYALPLTITRLSIMKCPSESRSTTANPCVQEFIGL